MFIEAKRVHVYWDAENILLEDIGPIAVSSDTIGRVEAIRDTVNTPNPAIDVHTTCGNFSCRGDVKGFLDKLAVVEEASVESLIKELTPDVAKDIRTAALTRGRTVQRGG